jgi:pimeloyl-ACP methyl ester carboxylesterase
VSDALAYEESGSGVPLVLLHAFPLHSGMWSEQRAALASQARVITPDLPGFGRTPLPSVEPSLDVVADAVVALLDDLGLDQVVLGGLSLGGYVAMALLRRHPERVSALILMDTKAGADPEAARANRERIATAVVHERSVRVVLTDVLPGLVGKRTKRRRGDVLIGVTDMVRGADPAAIAWVQRAMAARPDSFDTLRDVKVPTLVVVGEDDEVSPPADAEAMVEALPDARLVVAPGSGHLSAVEVPDVVTFAIREFLEGL